MYEFLTQIFPYALAFTAPILITAIGGLISERSGVVNIGLEGLMVVGSFASAYTMYLLTNGSEAGTPVTWVMLLISLFVAMLAGGLFAALHAYASISLKANQIISGTAINMLAASFTVFFSEVLTGKGTTEIIRGVPRENYPILKDIPFLGELLFTKSYLTTYAVFAIVAVVWFILMKTPLGLRLRACGEYPQAAESMGINVIKMRYGAVITSGCFAGLGGAIIILTYSNKFDGTVSGLGFLALATLIFGQWKPWKVMGAAFFFGFMRTMSTMALTNESLKLLALPVELYKSLPYVLTLVALFVFSKNTVAPKALGETFDSGKR